MENEKDNKAVKSLMSELYREAYLNGYRVIVAGSRGFTDYELMSRELDKLFWDSCEFEDRDIKVVSGMTIRYADERKLTKILFPANWKSYHRIAGFLRNEDMLFVATHLVVFSDGKSNGTRHMIEIAKKRGIPIWGLIYSNVEKTDCSLLEKWQ